MSLSRSPFLSLTALPLRAGTCTRSPMVSPVASIETFERHRRGLAAADAERGNAAALVVRLERGQERHHDARAGRADRVPERGGAAVDVDLVVRNLEVAHRGHGDHGERLVDLVEIDLFLLPPQLTQQ